MLLLVRPRLIDWSGKKFPSLILFTISVIVTGEQGNKMVPT